MVAASLPYPIKWCDIPLLVRRVESQARCCGDMSRSLLQVWVGWSVNKGMFILTLPVVHSHTSDPCDRSLISVSGSYTLHKQSSTQKWLTIFLVYGCARSGWNSFIRWESTLKPSRRRNGEKETKQTRKTNQMIDEADRQHAVNFFNTPFYLKSK